MHELFEGVFTIKGKIATANMVRGAKVYGEDLVSESGTEYRLWNPYRSKLAAAILNGMKHMQITRAGKLLYLGAASGTTPSHVSDIIGAKGVMYCVEISERSMRQLVALCERRQNMLPILADASAPEYLEGAGTFDVIYQDIASKDQAEILLKNSAALKSGGYAYFVIKSQSIDISMEPGEIYKRELAKLHRTFEVLERIDLEPYDSDHLFAVLRKID